MIWVEFSLAYLSFARPNLNNGIDAFTKKQH